MKKLILISAFIVITAASLIMILANGSNNKNTADNILQEKPKEETKSCCSSGEGEKTSGSFTANSIYQINSVWKNQFGNEINIGDLKGKTQVFAMIFANCTYACPIIANDMRRIEESLSSDELKQIQFTLVSIDPERDTPEKLKQFAKDQNLNFARWQLLTGDRSDIDDLAALLGFRYKKENDGSFSHSNIITILNKEGEIIHQQVGLNQDIANTLNIIKNHNKQGV